ncbi:protein HID1-like isoform X2 [Lethenteron reissneri]|uniref:protein HID1-like isoform X2 n=1 Tax=Lethenteron reissneri TaxID=7753 RepID=UPI002AB78FCA|nr:protein HID1-like isoform X2 [Lethenteron reissneri]XP_061425948.1 protein HID1-like isoform X2 [Lethenteron reissneri]
MGVTWSGGQQAAGAVRAAACVRQVAELGDEAFWSPFLGESDAAAQDAFRLLTAGDVRALRDELPSGLSTLIHKAVEKLRVAAESGCTDDQEPVVVLSCIRLLTRLLPFVFEDAQWKDFFWAHAPTHHNVEEDTSKVTPPLAEALLLAIAELLFCPGFTVTPHRQPGPDTPEDTWPLDSCEFIWEAGVGVNISPPQSYVHDTNRLEILNLLLTCFSEVIYQSENDPRSCNSWVKLFCSKENRHTLALFTSLLNVVFAYDPVGYGVPYNYLLVRDHREPLVEVACQVLIAALDGEHSLPGSPLFGFSIGDSENPQLSRTQQHLNCSNLFVTYLSKIHTDEDFQFILSGLVRLLNNPLQQTYLPYSTKRVHFHQELLVLFWILCQQNKNFLSFVLKTNDMLGIVVPILYYLNDARDDDSQMGLLSIGVFILLMLSGERNFGIHLNNSLSIRVPLGIRVFNGTHADLLIIVFHQMITRSQQKLQNLFDCLMTIVANVSPFLKSTSMVSATKLVQLLEVFSSPHFLFSSPHNPKLLLLLLEVFNNVIQYQFNGNCHLVYAMLCKRSVFNHLANLPVDKDFIEKTTRKTEAPRGDKQPSMSVIDSPEALQPIFHGQLGTRLRTVQGARSEISGPGDGATEESKFSGTPDCLESTSWKPTPKWVSSWKSKLPLNTIMKLLHVLVPQVKMLCLKRGLEDETQILRYLKQGSMVGLLPVPHRIITHRCQPNKDTARWFSTYFWSVVCDRNIDPPIWLDSKIKMFKENV